ncbi:MAG: hypothetical protein PF542_03310 [Nanoarchaeota archaeon]|jgi:hypothetical protein|nr:hypothetical protein [Nanoarchaeota archaeon]
MKSLGEVEDEYKNSFELLVDEYREKLKVPKLKDKARNNFSKKLNKLLKRRGKDYKRYVNSHGQELLEMPKKKERKELEPGVYHAYNFDFNHSFWDRFKQRWKMFKFRAGLLYRHVKYHMIPSWVKFSFFRLGVFFSSLSFDIGNVYRLVKSRIGFHSRNFWDAAVEKVMMVVNWFKVKNKLISDWFKARAEAKKKKESDALTKKQQEIADKQKRAEEEEKAVEKELGSGGLKSEDGEEKAEEVKKPDEETVEK